MNESSLAAERPAPLEKVSTDLVLFHPAAAVWQCLMFFEDVPRRPWLLSLLMPRPVRSEGDKHRVGSPIRCTYERGYLVKRMTEVEPERRLGFEVVEQRLGIEHYARACEGSYALEPVPGGTRVTLTTAYRSALWPRFLFRPLERHLCHRLHRHILFGMRDALTAAEQRVASLNPGAQERGDSELARSR